MNKDKNISEAEYVSEYEARLGKRFDRDRAMQVKQTYVRFSSLNKNDNDAIEWAEYEASGKVAFDQFDTNKDGILSSADPKPVWTWEGGKADQSSKKKKIKKIRTRPSFRMPTTHSKRGLIKTYDFDGDGSVTWAEFNKSRRAKFDETDGNANGTLDQKEYVSEFEYRMDMVIKKTRKRAIRQTYIRFNAIDVDADKGISFAEYKQSGERMYQRLDTNKDGNLSGADKQKSKHKKMTSKKIRCQNNE